MMATYTVTLQRSPSAHTLQYPTLDAAMGCMLAAMRRGYAGGVRMRAKGWPAGMGRWRWPRVQQAPTTRMGQHRGKPMAGYVLCVTHKPTRRPCA